MLKRALFHYGPGLGKGDPPFRAPGRPRKPQEGLEGQLDRLQQLQSEVVKFERELSDALGRQEDLAREAARARTDLERKLRQLADLEAASEEDVRIVRAAERVSEVMEEFKRRLLAKKIHELERLVAERFTHLARKREFISRVLVHPETFELSLFDHDGQPVLKERLSAGEQQLLAVAFLWALAVASGRNLPVVIDTPLGRMDHEHRRSLVERYFPFAAHQVVLLSTDAEIDERYRDLLVEAGAIDREYMLRFNQDTRQSEITTGYFWS
jgi:DNA sulfur modification protein DndD